MTLTHLPKTRKWTATYLRSCKRRMDGSDNARKRNNIYIYIRKVDLIWITGLLDLTCSAYTGPSIRPFVFLSFFSVKIRTLYVWEWDQVKRVARATRLRKKKKKKVQSVAINLVLLLLLQRELDPFFVCFCFPFAFCLVLSQILFVLFYFFKLLFFIYLELMVSSLALWWWW